MLKNTVDPAFFIDAYDHREYEEERENDKSQIQNVIVAVETLFFEHYVFDEKINEYQKEIDQDTDVNGLTARAVTEELFARDHAVIVHIEDAETQMFIGFE